MRSRELFNKRIDNADVMTGFTKEQHDLEMFSRGDDEHKTPVTGPQLTLDELYPFQEFASPELSSAALCLRRVSSKQMRRSKAIIREMPSRPMTRFNA